MKPLLKILWILIFFFGCTKGDMVNVARIAVTGDPISAQQLAVRKAAGYAANPKALERDIRNFENNFAALVKNSHEVVKRIWGEKEAKIPQPKNYVKYTQNYLCRALVDFDRGLITVETVEQKSPLKSLKNAIVTTMLTPNDPRAVDLYSAKTVKLGQTPFLYREVRDHEDNNIRWSWRAERFADFLIENRLRSRAVGSNHKKKRLRYVKIPMVRDHLQIRAQKYRPVVERFAKRFSISRNLVFAIMKTESDFNPYAVSDAPAFGLMQIVPATAGREVAIYLNKKGPPSDKFLLNPENNIQYGSAYLHLLHFKYFNDIKNAVSREYCVIAAYNTGPGNVLRTFDPNRKRAPQRINSLGPLEVFQTLQKKLPYHETCRYLTKVIAAKKSFVYSSLY